MAVVSPEPFRRVGGGTAAVVCEQLLFVLNRIAALKALTTVPNKADIARVGIVTWYYRVYSAASAMIAAADGSFPDNHTDTARQWRQRFSAKGLTMPPFADCRSSLTAAAVANGSVPIRARGVHSLVVEANGRNCRGRVFPIPIGHVRDWRHQMV
jgi:hypothetical protein